MKLRLILATAIISLLTSGAVYAQDIKVTVNNTPIDFTGAEPTIIEGRTLVPLRGVFEKLGFTIEWEATTKTATLTNSDTVVTAKVNELKVNSVAINDVQPQIINDYFMVPVRAISEAAGCDVQWEPVTKTVAITVDGAAANVEEEKNVKGTLTETADEYIDATYTKIKAIREHIKAEDDQVLMRFLGLGYVWDKEITPTVNDYSKLNTLLAELKAVTPPENMADCQGFINSYCDMMNKAVELSLAGKAGTIDNQQLLTDLDMLKEEKDNMAMEFSVVLYKVLEENKVFFEGAYDEYLLDMLK